MVHRIAKSLVVTATLGLVAVASADATSNHTTYVTFSRSLALPGVELLAGTYIFELASPDAAQNLVHVLSKDRRKVYLTAFTEMVARPVDQPSTQPIALGEPIGNGAPPIRVWYPVDDRDGRAFIY